MGDGARGRESIYKIMIIIRLGDLNHRLNIMIMNVNMVLMERLPGTITKDTITNGMRGRLRQIPRIRWPLLTTGSMSGPEQMTLAADHKTH